MTIYQKLTGTVTITDGKPDTQSPSGLLLQAYMSSGSPAQLSWLGSARVAPNGDFTLLANTNTEASDNMIIHVYNNDTLIKQFPLNGAKENVQITITAAEYDTAVPDDVIGKEHTDYFIVSGTLLLGQGGVAAVPQQPEQYQLVLQKVLFRDEVPVAGTQVDAFGRFEFKVPYRLLYADATNLSFNSLPKLQIILEKDGVGITAASAQFAISDAAQTVDIAMTTAGLYPDFYTEYGHTATVITELTGLLNADFHTIKRDGPGSEMDILQTVSGINPDLIAAIIAAATLNNQYALNVQHAYALARAGYHTIEAICGLSDQEITDIITYATSEWIAESAETIATTLSQIAGQRSQLAINEQISGTDTVAELLVSGISDPEYHFLAYDYLDTVRRYPDLQEQEIWEMLIPTYGEAAIVLLQQALQLLALTGIQKETIAWFADGSITSLCSFSLDQWQNAVTSICNFHQKLCVPESILGTTNPDDYTNTELINAYAAKLYETTNELFSTQAIRYRLLTDDSVRDLLNNPDGVISMIDGDQDFDLKTNNVWQDTYSLPDGMKHDLLLLQNVTRLTDGDTPAMKALITQGIKSSAQVVSMSLPEFTAILPGEDRYATIAQQIYAKAKQIDMHIKQAYTQLLPGNYAEHVTMDWSESIWVKAEQPEAQYSYPDLESLFGSMDFCACSDCSSMYSPSAYFTDVFNFIKTKLTGNAGKELIRRRPDLQHIDLSCKNANTAMPYIDLVNEVLELQVLRDIAKQAGPDQGMMVPDSFQTTATAEELAAYPEHTYNTVQIVNNTIQKTPTPYGSYTKVYDDRLSTAIFPNSLPFNLATDESRVFLQHLGHSRKELMQLFQSATFNTVWNSTGINAYTAAAEALEINTPVADIITNTAANDPWLYYGFPAENTWYDDLCTDLETLLHRIQVEYKNFLEMLTTDFLNPVVPAINGRAFAITAKDVQQAATCKIEALMLAFNVTPGDNAAQIKAKKVAFFDKLHRFIRLINATGWTVYQLDTVLRSLNAGDITVSTFIQIAQAAQWSQQFGIAPEFLSALWGGIDTVRYMNVDNETQPEFPSAYDRLFRNKGVTNPTDPNFEDIAQLGQHTIQDNLGTIIAAYNTTEEDIKMAIGSNLNVATSMSLLNRIQQHVLLYRLCGYTSLKDLYYNLQLPFNLSFDDATPTTAMDSFGRFLEAQSFADHCVLKTEALQFLLQHRDNGNSFIAEAVTIQAFYEQLRTDLKQLLGDSSLAANTAETIALKDRLEQVTVQQFTATLGTDQDYTKALLSGLIVPLTSAQTLLEILVSDAFINSDMAITPTGLITGLITFDELYRTYHLCAKAALIADTLLLGSELSILLQQAQVSLGIFDINALPVTPVPATQDLIDGFINLNNWIELRDSLRLTDRQLIDMLKVITTGPDNSLLLDTLADTLLWNADDLMYLLGDGVANKGALQYTFSPNVASTHDYRKASLLLQVNKIVKATKQTGLSARALSESLLPEVTTEQSVAVRKAAKAKYEINEWYSVVKPLQDTLRKSQRNALVDYLLANPNIVLQDSTMKLKNENDLFAYLLIDVEMESCMKTSRLKLGISSLQLFLDRGVLNLEKFYNISRDSNGAVTGISIDPITLTEDNIAQWQSWRKWYRTWEANRKIFMYPENWIEPELRDQKTTLFKELESHLLQDEVTDIRVEDGFRTYLEGLEEVARLEPVSAYHQTSYGKNILHVFARTDSNPQRYFYRSREDNEWSEWQKVSVDIKSQHVSPVMWNNKLYLFWLTFNKKKNTLNEEQLTKRRKAKEFNANGRNWSERLTYGSAALIDDTENDALAIWNVTLNWSQFRDGKWLGHELSKDIIELDVSKMELNSNDMESFATTTAADTMKFLTKNGSVTIDEFFKNRIFLHTPYDLAMDSKEGIAFNLAFAAGFNECATGFHTFLWKGDNSRDPYALRDSDRGWQIVSPYGTHLNQMKFVQNPNFSGGLHKDTSYDKKQVGYYTYSTYNFFPSANAYKKETSKQILQLSPTRYRLTTAAINDYISPYNPLERQFFYEDAKHTFFVENIKTGAVPDKIRSNIANRMQISMDTVRLYVAAQYAGTIQASTLLTQGPAKAVNLSSPDGYKFHTFYHAQATDLIAALNRGGIPQLLQLSHQSQPDTMNFQGTYAPTNMVNTAYPTNAMQFQFTEAYSMYNWELFFHAPMLIAQQLSNNQQFAEAQKWYHYIFNPTSTSGGSGAQRYWKFKPFYTQAGTPAQTLTDLLISIHNNNPEAVAQVSQWEKDPFNPHRIARMRVLAYMKNVLMKYLDNLIAWADNLFKRDTIESINEATQLYILAANLLGERPEQIPARVKRTDLTFDELEDQGLDALSNAMVAIESFLAPNQAPGVTLYNTDPQNGADRKEELNVSLETFYFCLPKNDKLLSYWDTLADRLFKIRNCMNIDGLTRQLALYEPPIDPALLVRAKAMGLSTESLMNDLFGKGRPFYRFSYMVQKTNELLGDVKALGGSMLSALEKKDAEALSLLRSGQEYDLLEKVKAIKTQQIAEATSNLDNLRLMKSNTQIRYDFYSSRPFKNANEQKHLDKMQSAMTFQIIQGALQTASGILSAIPTFHLQAIASGMSSGGLQLANVMQAASAAMGIKVAVDNSKGAMAATTGGYERRRDDWQLQAATAAKELEQLEQQILAAEIRLDIANTELRNHELQMDHNIAVDNYMRSKFTNADLYTWMITQLATTYFQTYQMAYDLAKQADVCFQSELPVGKYPTGGFIKYGYWDSLKKGLLSGERLQMDLRKMELAYMESNERELELTKHVSLAMFSPQSIIQLRESGTCTLDIPEVLFDLDYPGHYLRRIKSVSISVPCVAGPYTTINCELRQVDSQYRKSASTAGSYTDPDKYVSVNSSSVVATSSAQNDSGVFELNFRDERYLPFEGTGAISKWSISFPDTYRQFDYDTINDIILHIRYTARSGGDTLKAAAEANIETTLQTISADNVLHRYFSARHEFSNNWYAYAQNYESNSYARLQMSITQDNFPFFTQGKSITVQQISVGMNGASNLNDDYTVSITYTTAGGYKKVSETFTSSNAYVHTFDLGSNPIVFANNTKLLQIAVTDSEGNPVNATELLDDLYVVLDYTIGSSAPGTEEDDVALQDAAIDYIGLTGWWRADSSENTVNAGKVAVLKDLSNTAADFVLYLDNINQSLVSQDGTTYIDFVDGRMASGANGTHGDPFLDEDSFTIFFVGDCGLSHGIDSNASFYYSGDTFNLYLRQNGVTWTPINNTMSVNNLLICSLSQASTSVLQVYNLSGNTTASQSISNRLLRSDQGTGCVLGGQVAAWSGLTPGSFYEAIVYNRVLSTEEIQSVLAYLKSKYPFLNA